MANVAVTPHTRNTDRGKCVGYWNRIGGVFSPYRILPHEWFDFLFSCPLLRFAQVVATREKMSSSSSLYDLIGGVPNSALIGSVVVGVVVAFIVGKFLLGGSSSSDNKSQQKGKKGRFFFLYRLVLTAVLFWRKEKGGSWPRWVSALCVEGEKGHHSQHTHLSFRSPSWGRCFGVTDWAAHVIQVFSQENTL